MPRTLTLYHIPHWRSTRALWMYHELERAYADSPHPLPALELKKMDPKTFRTKKPKEFLELNPNGKLPTLVDGDVVMWDGCAICHYLLDQFDVENRLAPSDKDFRAALYKLSFYMSGTVDNLTAYSSPIQMVKADKSLRGKSEENMEFFRKVAGPVILEQLGDRDYLYGDRFSALDVIVGYSVNQFFLKEFLGGLDDRDLARVLRPYSDRMAAREGYKKAIA